MNLTTKCIYKIDYTYIIQNLCYLCLICVFVISMYLEKLEIQGFKSFATKNKLTFPGAVGGEKRGITAIVGPNGSGKSNIADAIRWVLGEQSMKSLRAKLGEDVIFSGTKNKGKQNLAEVSLYLNNQSEKEGGVGNKAPIPYSEMVLTRRVYRNGENEYLINNNKTKLSEIQMLLAKANFGQKTYSVIGQGMVEDFLKVSPKERKEFFDEATGIKEFQIKRETSLNKLINSYKNLEQAQALLKEIEPHLRSLTRQVNKLQKKDKLETELNTLLKRFFKYRWHKLNDQFIHFNNQFLETEKEKNSQEAKLISLNKEFNQIQEEKGVSEEFGYWSEVISDLQKKRETLVGKLATLEAQKKLQLEAKGNFDLSWLFTRQKELGTEIRQQKQETQKLETSLKTKQAKLESLEKNISDLRGKVNELNQNLRETFQKSAQGEARDPKLQTELENINQELKNISSWKDIEKIKKSLNELRDKVKKLLSLDGEKDKTLKEEQKKINQELEEKNKQLENYYQNKSALSAELNTLKEKLSLLESQIKRSEEEQKEVKEKIQKYSKKGDENQKTEEKNQEKLEEERKKIDQEINKAREKLSRLGEVEKEKKEKISALQQKSQNLQQEINHLNNRLNDFKIKSTKYETKLEDLEGEIKQSLTGSLKEIKQNRLKGKINPEETQVEIKKLENQLSQIGGIDPETETEYYQTKEKHDFLTEQISDLEKAIKSLENIIKELDVNIKEKFEKEFKRIHKNFEKYFKILFSGGEAKIKTIPYLEEESDEEREKSEQKDKITRLAKSSATGIEGIDIQVHPPGKKITSISMLSGGEKALTAIALICAIISANPSPFVVLDEVDAALDEANSERFAKILDDLSYKTQFILITHNRASMHKANVLYGTTMDESGISKLLSIQMESQEAQNQKSK